MPFGSFDRRVLATNSYPWQTFAEREEQDFDRLNNQLLASIHAIGFDAYEPIVETPEEVVRLAKVLQANDLSLPSIYVNSVLHDAQQVEASTDSVLAIAAKVKPLGTRIIVTNPSPIRWGGDEDKTDEELRCQAQALNELGARLRRQGQVLAYHNHDAELRQGAREFHHMLTATDPANVKLCLDAHWVFRGCGDSAVAVFDAVQHYHSRIVELHLRQSMDGIWLEAFAMEGDLDYPRLFRFLEDRKLQPHLVLEQAVEQKSKKSMSSEKAHQAGYDNLAAYLNR